MARKTLPLTDTQIRQAKAADKPLKLFDGGGLFLLVGPRGSKGWRFKYRFADKEKLISFGNYPSVSLADARKERDRARALLAKGIEPSLARKTARQEEAARRLNTFRNLATEWHGKQSHLAPTTLAMTWRRLELDVFPAFGSTPVTELTPRMILFGVLRPMEKRGVVELAHRTKSIISRVLRYGVACGYIERDFTADLRGALPAFERQHLAALTDPQQVGALLRALDGYDGSLVIKAALCLHPLVVTRPGELRHMEWTEVDFAAGIWNIPAGRMKMKSPHIVPLSRQAAAILQDLQLLTGAGRFVFPSVRSTAQPISNNSLNAALRRIGYSTEEMTSHGWRAVFRTLADEVLKERVDLIEAQLAHQVRDTLGRAYNRTSFLPERCKLMQRWADYLDELKASQKVSSLSRG
ncbi:integrase arm-type DNA-binding domain-containing protein [Syntrophotalea acetylenica]|uniref:tyrosine-type recombinase/integrase n=1 Tax=Syntrophotalea acetylenica TaxID=29542 RepID=UPI002A37139F|nr:integrase arm-type DNA-binding domain-containing protein [Syntrophotalea acetylenica]MDY0262710.1 integrase arm-type DNA-binding domain-containing protein [Syntrophotalea acetylenica]